MITFTPGDTIAYRGEHFAYVEPGCATRMTDCPHGGRNPITARLDDGHGNPFTVCLPGDDVTFVAPARGWRYDGTGPLFDAGETICRTHADFRLGYHPDHWTPATDDGACFICAEDRLIGPH